jgi:hypothetical protein
MHQTSLYIIVLSVICLALSFIIISARSTATIARLSPNNNGVCLKSIYIIGRAISNDRNQSSQHQHDAPADSSTAGLSSAGHDKTDASVSRAEDGASIGRHSGRRYQHHLSLPLAHTAGDCGLPQSRPIIGVESGVS